MNVLILSDLVTFSGVGNYIKILSRGLCNKGHNVILATSRYDFKIENVECVILKQIDSINLINIISNLITLNKIIRKYSIDVIHTNHRMSSFLVGIYNMLFKHVPSVWTSHSSSFPMNIIKRILGYYGDRCIAISTESRNFMINSLKINKNKINLIYNGVDSKSLLPLSNLEIINLKNKWNIPLDKIVFCVHGRIAYTKGIDFLIDTIASLDEVRLNKIIVVCSGDFHNDYFNYIYQNIIDKGLIDVFVFIGWQSSRDVLGIANVMLQPSRIEGFPLSDAEAFIMGVPVIRTRVGGFLDMVDLCVGFDFGDKKKFLKCIIDFIDNPNMYEDMSIKAKKYSLSSFTSEIMVNKTIDIYKQSISDTK